MGEAMTEGNDRRLPGEVVETYRQPEHREVVGTYTRPLPRTMCPPPPPAEPPRRRKKGLWIFLICAALVCALAAAAYFWPRLTGEDDWSGQEWESEKELTVDLPACQAEEGMTLRLEESHGSALTPQEIYRLVNPSVVTVEVWLDKSMSIGTGVIFTDDGYLLTNYHVVEGGWRCQVLLADNRLFEAKYVAGDRDNDLAVLKIDGTDLPAAELGRSDDLAVGDPVYAIGNPLGVELRGTFTNGIVSAINRDVQVDGRSMTLVQTNAALNSGNSGGPLINQYGQVVGINTIKMYSEFSTVEGLGFAIPTSTLEYIVNQLLEYGEVLPEPRIGVSVSTIGEVLPNGDVGVLVQVVDPGCAADRAGVLVDDYVVEADGEQIASSSDLLRVRRRFKVGDQMELTLWRSGQYLTVTLDLLESVAD